MKLFLAILAVLLLAGCDKYAHKYELDERSFGPDTLKEIEQDSGITLPTGARGLHYFYKPPIDPGFAAKIELPVESKDEVLRRISAIKQESVSVSGDLGPRFPWWVSARASVLLDRQSRTKDTYLHAILTDEEGRMFLYLEWWVF